MEPDEIDQWIEAVVDALRPALLVQARAWASLGTVAPPPEELGETLARHALALLGLGDG